jgi:hypothetical protein
MLCPTKISQTQKGILMLKIQNKLYAYTVLKCCLQNDYNSSLPLSTPFTMSSWLLPLSNRVSVSAVLNFDYFDTQNEAEETCQKQISRELAYLCSPKNPVTPM